MMTKRNICSLPEKGLGDPGDQEVRHTSTSFIRVDVLMTPG